RADVGTVGEAEEQQRGLAGRRFAEIERVALGVREREVWHLDRSVEFETAVSGWGEHGRVGRARGHEREKDWQCEPTNHWRSCHRNRGMQYTPRLSRSAVAAQVSRECEALRHHQQPARWLA